VPIALIPTGKSEIVLVVQPFIRGVELSIDGLVLNGEVQFVVHEKRRLSGAVSFARDDVLQAPFPGLWGLHGAIRRNLEHVFASAGLDSWPFHAEAVLAGGKIFLLEVNARPAGGMIVDSVEKLTGLDLFEAFARIVLGSGSVPSLRAVAQRHVCEITIYPRRSGSVSAIKGLDALPHLPGYVAHRVFTEPGQEVLVEDREEYGVIAVAEGRSRGELAGRAKTILQTVEIETTRRC
jgi:biotin carboxylase